MKAVHLITGLLICVSLNAHAAGDATVGQQKAMACAGCHGMDGNSFSPEWPNLAGQHPDYIVKQAMDFQSGKRQNETMSPMVAGLSKEDLQDISAFFASQAVKPDPQAKSANGKKLFFGGNPYSKVPACSGCHGPNAAGVKPGKFPSLAGQKAGYVAKTLRDFRSEARNNDVNAIMQNITAKMTDKEIDAVATYISGIGAESQ